MQRRPRTGEGLSRQGRRGEGLSRHGSWVFADAAGLGVAEPAAGISHGAGGRGFSPATIANSARSVFGELIVLREMAGEAGGHRGLPLSRAEDVTRALRSALLSHAIDPPPAVLSGHTPDGRRLERPHAAFLALPDLRGAPEHATICGVAIALPREVEPEAREATLLAAARWEQHGLRLWLGRLGALQLERIDAPETGSALDPTVWTAPARRWASVTAIALHRNPGDLTAADRTRAAAAARKAEGLVAEACEHVGLPRPTRVRIARRSRFPASPSAPAFMPFPRKTRAAKFARVCVHAEIEFAEPVAGPVVLGAGRYFGVGLCRAWVE